MDWVGRSENRAVKVGGENLSLRLRVVLGAGVAVGPGKADLLEGIDQTGSIAAAGRRMKMSYKRAWYLLDVMNQCFKEPLARTRKGGRGAGGAQLTPTGKRVLAIYRSIEAQSSRAAKRELLAFARLVNRPPAKSKR
jgi:molybdate transport system regulatory protein